MNKIYVQIHYSLKNTFFKKDFHSKHGLWRRTCYCCRCLYIILEKKTKRKNRRKVILRWNLGSREKMPLGFITLFNLQHFITSHKDLSSLQMQIKLSVSSCFLFMVAILPFLHQLYFYLVKQNFLHDHRALSDYVKNQTCYTRIHRNRWVWGLTTRNIS